jgi:hypothetical protein
VLVQLMVEGLKVAFEMTVKTRESLDPPDVWTQTGPLAVPEGTVVTMKVSVQSAGLATVAVSVPPVPFEKKIRPEPWETPNPRPSRITVLPMGPDGLVAPLMLERVGTPSTGAVDMLLLWLQPTARLAANASAMIQPARLNMREAP